MGDFTGLAERVAFQSLGPRVRGPISRLRQDLEKHRFGLAALFTPIRAIPEIIVGPYPVGWDTIAFYVPNTPDWAAGKAGFLEMLGTAPLMYMIAGPGLVQGRGWGVWRPPGGEPFVLNTNPEGCRP